MNKILIPYKPPFHDLETENIKFQVKKFQENRMAVLKELRCISGIPEVVRTLNPGIVYKIVATPEGGTLNKDVAGNLQGVFYKDGKIIQHARLKAVQPSLIKAATTVGSQVLLISIALQLNRIEKGIERISNGLHDDRISEIDAGINLFQQAMVVQNNEKQSHLIDQAIPLLNTGLAKTIRSLKRQIKDAPEPDVGFLDDWRFFSKAEEAKKKMRLAEDSFLQCLRGIRTLSECYALQNEPIAAEFVIGKFITDLKVADIELAARKARLIEFKEDILPEKLWKDFLAYESSILPELTLYSSFSPNSVESIEIEFKPEEIIEV